MKGYRKGGTRSKYVIVLSTFLIFLMVCLVAFYFGVKRATDRYTEADLYASVEHQTYQFRYILDLQFTALTYLADHIGQTDQLLGEDSMSLLRALEEGGDFQRAMICTNDGIGHTTDGIETWVGSREYFKKGMQGENSISDPLESSLNGEERVVLSVPIWRGTQVVAVLGVSCDFGSISTMLFSDMYGGKGIPFLISRNGTLIASANNLMDDTRESVQDLIHKIEIQPPESGEAVYEALKEGRLGNCQFDWQGDRYYWSYEPLGRGDWTVCYIISRDAAQENYHFIQRYEMLLNVMLLLGVAAMLAAFLRFYIQDRHELLKRANTDLLTALLNKESMQEAVEYWLSEGEKSGIQAVLMLDLDNFKQINDTYGHVVGDRTLQQTAALLRSTFRADDMLGRVGGDEFMVVMKNVSDPKAVERQMTRVCSSMQSMLVPEAPELTVGCSIGAAYYPEHGKTFAALYRQADQALYQAKRRGRGTWVVCETEEEI